MSTIDIICQTIADKITEALPTEDVSAPLEESGWRKDLPPNGRVLVVPSSEVVKPMTDSTNLHTFNADIVFQIPVATNAEDSSEANRINLNRREAVQKMYGEDGELRDLVIDGAQWIGFAERPIWNMDDIKSQQQFTAILTPIYQFER